MNWEGLRPHKSLHRSEPPFLKHDLSFHVPTVTVLEDHKRECGWTIYTAHVKICNSRKVLALLALSACTITKIFPEFSGLYEVVYSVDAD